MQAGKTAWRNSASLIILGRNSCKTQQGQPDYQVLVMKRPETMRFMPKAFVFPGGATDPADESNEWVKHFKDCGITDQKLAELTKVQGPRPLIFQNLGISAMKKEISLRITAIREAFEEIGILFCRKSDQINDTGDFGGFVEEFNREHWQEKIIEDPSQFISLCKEYDLVPDIWKLYEWSAWLTPAKLSKRFQTAFFLISTENQPKLLPHKDEAYDVHWATPNDILHDFHEEKIDLATPQVYELQRLYRYDSIESLTRFARLRNNLGTTLQFPIPYATADGIILVFPGDDLYPKNVDFDLADYDGGKYAERTFAELRIMSKRIHRCEQRSVHNTTFVLNFNLPHGHIGPMVVSKL